ncbi:MAG: hypothetical protein WCQ47_08350, partial [bacterium]
MSKKEFLNFINTQENTPPSGLDNKVKMQIIGDLKDTPRAMLKRLSIIHVISALFTLSICPQFGIGPIGGGDGITSFVMPYGNFVCGLFCGAFFLGTTSLISIFALKTSELFALSRNSFWIFPVLSTASLILLMTLGSVLNGRGPDYSINFVLSWLVSGILLSIILVKTKTLAISALYR